MLVQAAKYMINAETKQPVFPNIHLETMMDEEMVPLPNRRMNEMRHFINLPAAQRAYCRKR